MKRLNKIAGLILAAVALANFGAQAQNKTIAKADKKMEALAYQEAIALYERGAKTAEDSTAVAAKLAQCYSVLRNTEKAELWYEVLMESGYYDAEQLWDYTQTLRGNYAYGQANKRLNDFVARAPEDSRGMQFVAQPDYEEKLKKKPERYEIQEMSFNTEYSEFAPMYFDENIVFLSNRDEGGKKKVISKFNNEPFYDIYLSFETGNEPEVVGKGADKAAKDVGEGVEEFAEELNTEYHEGPVTFSRNLSEIYFTRSSYFQKDLQRSKDKKVRLKIYGAELREDFFWGDFKEFDHNSDEYSVCHPALSFNGEWMVFASDMPGGKGGMDLYKSQLQTDLSWGPAINLGAEINTAGDEVFPFLHRDGTLYFSSNGHIGLGGLDVFESPMHKEVYKKPKNMGYPLNSSKDDFSCIVNREKNEGYIASNREGGKGSDDIYFFTMDPRKDLFLQGIVADAEERSAIVGAAVALFDKDNNLVKELKTDDDGGFQFELESGECQYYVKVNNGEEWSSYTSQNTACELEEGEIDLGRIPLELMAFSVSGIAKDKKNGTSLADMKVTVKNITTGESEELYSGLDGSIQLALDKDSDYEIRLEKDKYYARSGRFSTVGVDPGQLKLDRYIDLEFERIEMNKGVRVDNIYYEYGSHELTPEASVALDGVVHMLNDNPTISVEIGAHTDSRGGNWFNNRLSGWRAKSVADYLIAHGIAEERLTYKGYGEKQLLNNCADGTDCSDELHAENRRTEFKVLKVEE